MSDSDPAAAPAAGLRRTLPRRIRVAEVISSRYEPGTRPVLWDRRSSGIETVRTDEGEQIHLYSNGGQSSPAAGWELLLLKDRLNPAASESAVQDSVLWTLYGLPSAAAFNSSAQADRLAEDSH